MKNLILSIVFLASSSALACIPGDYEIQDDVCATNQYRRGTVSKVCVADVGKYQQKALTIYGMDNSDVAQKVVPLMKVEEPGRGGPVESYSILTGSAVGVGNDQNAKAALVAKISSQTSPVQVSFELTDLAKEFIGSPFAVGIVTREPKKRCAQ